ncbi:MAG: SUMF1/EgtB/PvdO family nonheme iron enzyme [Acidimicrobiales bacterium]
MPSELEELFEALRTAPANDPDWSAWVTEIRQWRQKARQECLNDDARYNVAQSQWAREAYVCGLVMLWDESFYDPASGTFLVEEYLDDAEREFGGFDVLILWHAYPRIGFDERNQYDFYRDIPGGLSALADIIARLHRRGVRAVIDYNPWDLETRREPLPDARVLADLVARAEPDGIFLDTLANAPGDLRGEIDKVSPANVFQSEGVVPLTGVSDHLMSWAQWVAPLKERFLMRDHWFEQRHMQHLVRRWHDRHRDELLTAWLNGAGVVMWENVFGSWYPWDEGDKALLKTMHRAQRAFGDLLSLGDWTPFVPMPSDALRASRWERGGAVLWALANCSESDVTQTDLSYALAPGTVTVDVFAGRTVDPREPSVTVPARGVACLVSIRGENQREVWSAIERAHPDTSMAGNLGAAYPETTAPVEPPVRRPVAKSASRALLPGTRVVPPGPRSFESVFRLRECGTYVRADHLNQDFPDQEQERSSQRALDVAGLAIDELPVSNAGFERFLDSTGYTPKVRHRFLDHWVNGGPPPGQADWPVTYVDLEDARAYAAWSGKRLPTEDEWQVAMSEGYARHGRRRVWEWTESEHSDGHNRFVIVKGGSDLVLGGSGWYAEGGPLGPERSAKFMLFASGVDRCSTVGFRCVVDLDRVGSAG